MFAYVLKFFEGFGMSSCCSVLAWFMMHGHTITVPTISDFQISPLSCLHSFKFFAIHWNRPHSRSYERGPSILPKERNVLKPKTNYLDPARDVCWRFLGGAGKGLQ